jgi:hypothetical protein
MALKKAKGKHLDEMKKHTPTLKKIAYRDQRADTTRQLIMSMDGVFFKIIMPVIMANLRHTKC